MSKSTARSTGLTRRGLEAFINIALVRWDARYQRMQGGRRPVDIVDTERHCAAMAERFARVSAYLSTRLQGGNHAAAVARQNDVAAGVRRALGYSYPRSDIRF